jgi:protein-disulfide isomerase-like protein with CxxC motif
VFEQVDQGEEGSDTYYLYATGDTQYPWNANWGGGRSITRTPTTNNIVATDGMTVEQWNNKVVNRSNLRQTNTDLKPVYKSNYNGKPAIFFNGDV